MAPRPVTTLLVLLGASPSLATAGIIYGNVRNEAGEPVSDADVIVSPAGSGSPQHVRSGGDGYYLVGDLPAGMYQVRAEKLGFRDRIEDDVTLRADETHALTLVLGKSAAPPPPPSPLPSAAAPAAPPSGAASPSAGSNPPVPRRRGSYKPKRRTIAGTIVAMDTRSVVVAVGMGHEVTVVYDRETEVEGELAVGKDVRIVAPVEASSYRRAKSIKVKD